MFWAAFLPIIRSSQPYIVFGTFYAVVMNRLLPAVGWNSILILVANGHNCIKCTKADVQLRTPDDGQKGCLKHVEQ
jgi:hypothetical protein